jgi:hypothetical protein
MNPWPNKSPEPRRWRCQFRYRGSRRESAVAQLSTLGHGERMLPPEIYDVFEKLDDSCARVRFIDGKEHLLSIYSCTHLRLNDTFLADIVNEEPQTVSYQWDLKKVLRVEDESGRLLYEKPVA